MSYLSFFLQAFLAITIVILVIYLPGRTLLRWLKLPLSQLEHLAAALTSGMAGFVLLYWGLSVCRCQIWIWGYLLIPMLEIGMLLQEARHRKTLPLNPDRVPPEPLQPYWPLGLVMLLGMILQTRFTAWTGWETSQGLSLLAWHAHDAPWHIYNIFQMTTTFPPAMPGFSGQTLKNYHMFSDLLWGGIRRLTLVDPWHLYFRIAPFLYSGLLTLGAFLAGHAWSGRKRTAYVFVVLTVFCSNFGYLMPLFFGLENYFLWDSIFWVQSPFGMIFNPGVSSSFGLVLMGLWALVRWLRDRQWAFLVIVALAWGVLPGFKVYPGLLLLSGLFFGGLWMMIFQKKSGLLTAFLCTLPMFLLVFIPPVWHAPSVVRLLPGYNLGAMLVAPDRMGLMSSATLKALFVNHTWMVALIMAGLAVVFLIGNLGIRSLGLLPLIKNVLKPRESDPILLLIAIVIAEAFGASILLVQSGVQWNTIQFFYYAVLLAGLPASHQMWLWFGRLRHPWHWLAIGAVVLVALPGTIQALAVITFHYDVNPATLEGLHWIREHADPRQRILRPLPDSLMTSAGWQQFQRNQVRGRMTSMKAWQQDATANTLVAQSLPATVASNTTTAVSQPGTPRLEQTDTAIIAAVTRRNTYLEDTVSAQIMGYPVEARAEKVLHFFQAADAVEARGFLEKENISYVIVYPGMQLPFDPTGVPLKKVFENHAMTIYKYIFLKGW